MLQLIRLRPAALRLPATRLFSTSGPSFTDTTAASPAATSAATPATPAAPFQKSAPMPFTINRTSSLNLPVYHRIKSGGTNKTTEIKKIEGDARVLSELITTELKLETKINPVTNHISIKGLHRPTVEAWLAQKGF
ncbi:mitochondrial ribosomal protein subunit img2 [Ophiostoma piceae UAMH 11346]|uniref:Large ribosomal subunit protein mL49 n=1 Tax=Ophiostoma piceae (strain UAMH 11346) TaxID=1262450 RepID=S3BT80_OPHP1|nr:mitochondrial ribosomal protein subunit img2 [Ophiostoma piceae UAMH 11346]